MNLDVQFIGNVELVPEHTIILDRSNCSTAPPTGTTPTSETPTEPSSPTTETPTTANTSSPTASVPTDSPDTCQGLQNAASSSSYCATNDPCTALECDIPATGDHAEMTVVPCHDPPAIRIVIKNEDDDILLDRTFDRSRDVPVQYLGIPVLTLRVTVEQLDNNSAIRVKVGHIV